MAPSASDSPLTDAIYSLVSPEAQDFLQKTILHQYSPVQVFVRQATSFFHKSISASYVFAAPYIDSLLKEQPEAVSLAAFVVLLATIWIVLSWVRRLMAFVTRLLFGALFWGFVGLVIMFVWNNGIWETTRQAMVVSGKLAGFATIVKDVWVGELRKYEEEARAHARG